MTVLLAIGGAVGAGDLSHPAPKTLQGSEVAAQIADAIESLNHQGSPPDVSCPPSEPVRRGWTFNCTVAGGGSSNGTLVVVEIDDRGGLRWAPAGHQSGQEAQ
jgi:hypothetical protein